MSLCLELMHCKASWDVGKKRGAWDHLWLLKCLVPPKQNKSIAFLMRNLEFPTKGHWCSKSTLANLPRWPPHRLFCSMVSGRLSLNFPASSVAASDVLQRVFHTLCGTRDRTSVPLERVLPTVVASVLLWLVPTNFLRSCSKTSAWSTTWWPCTLSQIQEPRKRNCGHSSI